MSFADPVANFLGNAQTMLVVIFCSLEIVEGRISVAEIATGLPCPALSPTSLVMSSLWHSIALSKSPKE